MTPTCRSCGAKFPGRLTCNHCGADSNAAPTVKSRIVKALGVAPKKPSGLTERQARRAQVRSITSTQGKKKHGRRY